ncbi:hypothetical protein ABTN03_19525, partial [Acinetobacter baumannii]
NLYEGEESYTCECKFLHKEGKPIALSWRYALSIEERLIFAVAKDITEDQKLQELLVKTNTLAKVGSWEIDVINQTVYWSDIVK